MKKLWSFTRNYATLRPSNTVLFPPYICVAFANSEMTRRICEERDLAVRAIGRCIEALVVDQFAVDIESSELSPSHLSSIEFTKMVFLALDNFYSFNHETVSSDILDVVQQTFSTLSRALPPELNVIILPAQTETLNNISDGKF